MLRLKLGELQKWWDEKIHIIKIYFENKYNKDKLYCRMGDIYLAKLGINIGNEIDKFRPVLIFQGDDWYIKRSGMVFIFPISSNIQKKKYLVFFDAEDIKLGNVCRGSVLIQQGRSISKFRLGHKIGKMKKEKLQEIKDIFEKFLYKNTPLQS